MIVKGVMNLQNAIEINRLSKIYKGGQKALNGLNLIVNEGEIFSLLGKNGAGKSTLINVLTTYLQPTDGEVFILGESLSRNTASIRKQLSSVAQKNSIDGYLTLYENMKFQGRLYHVDSKELPKRIEDLLTKLNLKQYKDKRVSDCSGGIQRRLDIAMSMVSIPKILFLDEPTTGLDIESRHAMWELIKKVNIEYGTTIFLTTHYLEEADELSHKICIIKDGKEQITGTSAELKRFLQQSLVRLYFEESSLQDKVRIITKLKHLDFVKKIRESKDTITIEVENIKEDYQTVLELGIENQTPFYRAEIVRPTLDDVFMEIASEEKLYDRNN
ncbi:ABC transporter ATP-binding protein [Listeria seeligeri]|uniref:ABC transporter ATP-binding protein n=1 Tax=Listeria seeligeri TaxID=1640 RepID=UPI001E59B0C6|nr:ABC transporter ATP-binding protein [Listeria seeligeri]